MGAHVRIAVLGSGAWGTTVASLVSDYHDVTLWARDQATVDEINTRHRNTVRLPGFTLPEGLRATSDVESAVAGAEVVIVGVPSSAFRTVLGDAAPYVAAGVPLVSLAKGLEIGSRMRMTEVIADVLPGHPAGALSGPNLAHEIMGGNAAASVIAMTDESIAADLQQVLRHGLFRVYRNHDVIGCELGGAFKNVVAIAVGMAQGLSVGNNTTGAVITRGLAEITRIGTAMGAEAATFAGLAGMGDLIATAMSPQSRNRYVGEQLGLGKTIDEVLSGMSAVAEGVRTVDVLIEIADELGVDVPVSREVYHVVHGESDAHAAYRGLERMPGHERDPG
jgi:glycerol-3-phosphate dehydrogenase (NAD(P)+)